MISSSSVVFNSQRYLNRRIKGSQIKLEKTIDVCDLNLTLANIFVRTLDGFLEANW